MAGDRFCPMIKGDCRREQCSWWDVRPNECAILSMALALWADVDEEDDDEDEEDKEKEAQDKKDNAGDEYFADGNIKEFVVKIKKLE